MKNYFKLKFGYSPPIVLIDHHFAHAVSAYFVSGFKQSLIITADLSGDSRSTALFYAENEKIQEVKSFFKPNSLGIFYALITQYLGFQYNNDECKVMALASYGNPRVDLNWLLKLNANGYELNRKYIDPRILPHRSNPSLQEPLFTTLFRRKIGHEPRRAGEHITVFHRDLASSAQNLLEKTYRDLLDNLQFRFKCNNLCLAGGISLNAELNSKMIYSEGLKGLFVQPVANDAGLALGGAVYHSFKNGDFIPKRLEHLYLGPEYKNREIRTLLDRLCIRYSYCKDIERKIARAIANGKIVAVFCGRMEYGPRALGNRSILADPRDRKMKDKINCLIKQRENFQPFAPSVIEDELDRFFKPSGAYANLDFMIVNIQAKNEAKQLIPAVVHNNDTSRVQVVRKTVSPRLYRTIQLFGECTGIPVLLNTSLNIKGQPIARTPLDAISIFFVTLIDCLAIENFWIEK